MTPSSLPGRHGVEGVTKVWVDGCFDMMHYGHANALRQARSMGGYLVVGVHSDLEITKHKGCPPVMTERERYAAVRACKWVDEVVEDAPYVTSLEMMDGFGCAFCVHGDDLATDASGRDAYATVKQAGRFRECRRTPTVSTTDIVGRMLLLAQGDSQPATDSLITKFTGRAAVSKVLMAPALRIAQFSSVREPGPTDTIVYVDGAFDLFHIGHIDFLRAAKGLGTYLVVGVHEDAEVERIKGRGRPVMRLTERVLGVLSCRYVDEVLIGAPYSVTCEVITRYRVSAVAHGATPVSRDACDADPYVAARERGIYRETEKGEFSALTAESIIDRIISRRPEYLERNRRKAAKDADSPGSQSHF